MREKLYAKKRGGKRRGILLILLFLLLAAAAFDLRLLTRRYVLRDQRISEGIRIGFVADLHSCDYGEGQKTLLEAIDRSSPDIILLGGDIIDDVLPEEKSMEFLQGIQKRYRAYYVTGNHEYWTGDIERIKNRVSSFGIPVLDGKGEILDIRGERIYLSGIDDPEAGEEVWKKQLDQAAAGKGGEFSILLSHRPERFSAYAEKGFDLVLAGHAHGGQWRLPFLINGVYAPNQGIFPKLAGGEYREKETRMIVSRGLARESTRVPRIFNRPEYVIVDLTP